MNSDIITRFDEVRETIKAVFKEGHPSAYTDVVRVLVTALDLDCMDPERITTIDHGKYRGAQLFVIACKGYQPSEYWATGCAYGSCSGCDTLKRIRGYDSEHPSDEQAHDYLTLALHLAQRMRRIL